MCSIAYSNGGIWKLPILNGVFWFRYYCIMCVLILGELDVYAVAETYSRSLGAAVTLCVNTAFGTPSLMTTAVCSCISMI